MIEPYDLTFDEVVAWANNYSTFEELEKTAKALYSIYVQERKSKYPELHKANKQAKKNLNIQKKLKKKKHPKSYRKFEAPLKRNKTIPYTETRR